MLLNRNSHATRLIFLRICILCIITFTAITQTASAQTNDSETAWQEICNALADHDDHDEEGWNEIHDIFTNLAHSPQNINEATLEDLQQIPLLTDRQQQDILKYRAYYGDIRSMSELSLITSLDHARRILLNTVFYAAPPAKSGYWRRRLMSDSIHQIVPDTIAKKGRAPWRYSNKEVTPHSVLFTMSIPTYQRKGYKDGTYRGYNLSHTLRYRYNRRNITAAFTAAQDAGEPFFSGTNKSGWDFYTGYFRIKNMGALRNMVAGHYQISVGMGLILNNGYRLSRTALLHTAPSAATVLRGHSSRQQNNLLQGAAATVAIPITGNKTISLTPFVSYRTLDATMDDEQPGIIRTLLTSGYHRTRSEIARRNTTAQTTAGLSASYETAPLRTSVNLLYVELADSLAPRPTQAYQRYRPAGRKFLSASVAYSYVNAKLHIAGETALSEQSRSQQKGSIATATANSIRYKINQSCTAFLLQRYYSYRFQSLMAKTFGDMSNGQNESGVYAGATATLTPRITLSAYADFAYHPWTRYGYDGPLRSFDACMIATYTHGSTTASMRYRYREQAVAEEASAMPTFSNKLDGTAQHTLRMLCKHATGNITYISQLHGTFIPTSRDCGVAASQAAGYKSNRLSLWGSIAYFNTSDYAARLYLTDRSVKYATTTFMAYGHGCRASLMAQADISKNITLAIRCSTLKYFDRNTISSGAQEISGSRMTDIQIQASIKL